jgi:hypothetical protein
MYNIHVINWSTDEKKFKKESPHEYKIWRLIQLINYGLDNEKLNRLEVKKAWNKIKTKIDTPTKKYLQFLLWGTLPS